MAYTEVYMQALLPELSSLPSIGSVEANFAQTSEQEEQTAFRQFRSATIEAKSVLASYGIAAYEDYIAFSEALYEEEEYRQARKLVEKAAACTEGGHGLRRIFARLLRRVSRDQTEATPTP